MDRPPVLRYRHPSEADYGPIVAVLDEWWSGRRADATLPRLWLQHFTGTSWLAETVDGQLAGFLIAFHSPDHDDTAVCRLVGTNPNFRRQGVGSALYEHCAADARAAGRTRIVAAAWPGNRAAIAFHRAIGFEVEAGNGTQNLYGIRAYPAYDQDTEDRAVLVRRL